MKTSPACIARYTLVLLLTACGVGGGGETGPSTDDVPAGSETGVPDTTDLSDATLPDAACVPACAERECGSDGCSGTCGTCATGICSAGRCVTECPDPLEDCGGECVDLETSSAHCGGCDTPCAFDGATAACVARQCTFVACQANRLDVDGVPGNGCEVACDGLAIQAPGALTLDIPTVHVTGTVMQDGKAASFAGSDATVLIRDRTTGFSADYLVLDADLSAQTYARRVVPGRYDFAYRSERCREDVACPYHPLASAVTIGTDGVVDLDVPTIALSGAVGGPWTAGGWPSSEGNPRVELAPLAYEHLAVRGVLAALDDLWGAGHTFARRVVPGAYRIEYFVDQCTPKAPCPYALIAASASLVADGFVSADIPTVRVSGVVRMDGAGMAGLDSSGTEGLYIRDVASRHEARMLALPDDLDGGSLWQRQIVPRTYDFEYRTDECVEETPCPDAPLHRDLALASDGVVDFDIPTVGVSGRILFDGKQPASTPVDGTGGVYIGRVGGTHEARMLDLSQGPQAYGTWQRRLAAGTYRIDYRVPACREAVPCPDYRVQAALPVTAEGVLDIDIPTVEVSGNLRFGGKPATQATQGSVFIEDLETGWKAVFLRAQEVAGASGAFTRRVVPGRYRLEWGAELCDASTPCYRKVLVEELVVSTGGALDLDVPIVDVPVRVTVDGGSIANPGGGLGSVRLEERLLDGGAILADRPYVGGATAPRIVVPGTYVVTYRTERCDPVLPCPLRILAGCD